jgi:hypothetical protein
MRKKIKHMKKRLKSEFPFLTENDLSMMLYQPDMLVQKIMKHTGLPQEEVVKRFNSHYSKIQKPVMIMSY